MKEYLGDRDPNLVADVGKIDAGVDGDDCGCLKQSCESEGSKGLPEVTFTNGRVRERQLDIAQCGALGEYGHIWEIFAQTLNFSLESLLVCMRSWIKLIFLSQCPFISWWGINVDKR